MSIDCAHADVGLVINLPDEEIQTTEERLVSPGLIRKEVRYRNGMWMVLYQDFKDFVFSLSLNSEGSSFHVIRNPLFRIPAAEARGGGG